MRLLNSIVCKKIIRDAPRRSDYIRGAMCQESRSTAQKMEYADLSGGTYRSLSLYPSILTFNFLLERNVSWVGQMKQKEKYTHTHTHRVLLSPFYTLGGRKRRSKDDGSPAHLPLPPFEFLPPFHILKLCFSFHIECFSLLSEAISPCDHFAKTYFFIPQPPQMTIRQKQHQETPTFTG